MLFKQHSVDCIENENADPLLELMLTARTPSRTIGLLALFGGAQSYNFPL